MGLYAGVNFIGYALIFEALGKQTTTNGLLMFGVGHIIGWAIARAIWDKEFA